MTSLAVNENNDLYLTPEKNLAVARGIEGVKQDCEHAMKTQLGELVLNLSRGMPTRDTVWLNWNPIQFEAYARRLLLSVPNVLAVVSFNIVRNGDTATYEATIQADVEALAAQAANGPVTSGELLTQGLFVITTEDGKPLLLG